MTSLPTRRGSKSKERMRRMNDLMITQALILRNPCYINNVRRVDPRYRIMQDLGPVGLMLHSVGCGQPSAEVFASRWNDPSCQVAVHAVIDANRDDMIVQCMPWNFRGWHAGGSANDRYIGVEMCESRWVKYPKSGGIEFEIIDRARAVEDALRAYRTAVRLFAQLCRIYKLDPMTAIISHREGGKRGIASGHLDPEHYWTRLKLRLTMDGFREDVAHAMEGTESMTDFELMKVVQTAVEQETEQLRKELAEAKQTVAELNEMLGKNIVHLGDVPWTGVREEVRELLSLGVINGGTSARVDPDDVRLPLNILRAVVMAKRYTDKATAEVVLGDAKLAAEPEEDPVNH